MNKYNCIITGKITATNLSQIKDLLLNKELAFYITVLSTDTIKISFFCDSTAICENIYIEFETVKSVKFTVLNKLK